MSFSQRAALHVIPLLARVVLGVAFVVAGWNKLMTERAFTTEEVVVLREAGVVVGDGEGAESSGGETTMRSLHGVTLMVQRAGWPYAGWAAWAATATELVGGALLLVGLFSRVWALGLAITMGVAFDLTSLPVLREIGLFSLPIPDYTRLVAQSALFVLALGVALVGPGSLSIDRAIFRRAVEPID